MTWLLNNPGLCTLPAPYHVRSAHPSLGDPEASFLRQHEIERRLQRATRDARTQGAYFIRKPVPKGVWSGG